MGRRARLGAMVGLVASAMTSICLLLFACFHWHNFWPIFTIVPCLLAVFIPSICYGYDDPETVRHAMDQETFHNCRELSYAIAALLLLSSYGVPALVWYNAKFHVAGVLVVYGAITLATWSFLLWLRLFSVKK